MQKTNQVSLIVLLVGMIFISSCGQAPQELVITPTSTLDGTLRPYPSDTPSITPLPTDYVTPTPSPTITPSATQVYYNVREGDDMYGIAFYYGISPQAIMTANPTINPRMMGPGTTLLIPVTPIPGSTATATLALTPTSTPRYKALHEPDCYPDASGGLWCFVLLENFENGALENVTAVITLTEGEENRSETAMMPLNLLPAGASLPLVVYFDPPVASDYSITAEVDFLLPVMPEDQRYLAVDIIDQSILISEDGQQAQITGKVVLPEDGQDARYLWINGTAFDEAGHVLASRRWDSEAGISAGEIVPFKLTLYSLGGTIDRVELLTEVMADQPSEVED